jgi:hypothetical protein
LQIRIQVGFFDKVALDYRQVLKPGVLMAYFLNLLKFVTRNSIPYAPPPAEQNGSWQAGRHKLLMQVDSARYLGVSPSKYVAWTSLN